MPSLYTEIKTNSNKLPKWVWITIGAATLIILVLGGLFLQSQHKLNQAQETLQKQQNDPAVQSENANKELIAKVGKLIILPSDESPTIATVTDLEKLKGQPFFAQAQVNDRVLIYSKNKKAILYRPSSNQIIELAPLLDNNTPGTPTN